MKRVVILPVAMATAAVAYAAASQRLGVRELVGRFTSSQSLPALSSTQLPFSYPAKLWREGIEGEVLLRIYITATGEVDSVVVERSSGHAELDSMAKRGAVRLKYHPARQGDQARAVWALLPVRFRQHSTAASPEDGG